MFEYHLPQFNNGTATSSALSLDLENDLPSVLQFPIGINDIGGSLVVELGVNIAKVWNDNRNIKVQSIDVQVRNLA